MRIFLLCLLLLTTSLTSGQKFKYSIEFGPCISFFSEDLVTLEYGLPINPATDYEYKIFENTYKRKGNIGYGTNLYASLNYQLHKLFFLSGGFRFTFLSNEITTIATSSVNYYSFTDQQFLLSIGENINGYIPNDSNGNTIWNIAIDENGILIGSTKNDLDKYTIRESVKTFYFSIPLKIGFDLNKKFQMTFGIINSILLNSNITTDYPYTDDRIIENNISSINKFVFSIQGGFSYKMSKRLSLSLNYQLSLTDMINMNERYEIKNGNRINIFSFNMNYIINWGK